MNSLFRFFSSLRLTVILLALGMMLVFFGTLDQVHTGIWETQRRYFESFFVVWKYPPQWWFFEQLHFLRVPMPGGYLLGFLLLVNLLAAHLHRFKLSWRHSGIIMVHSGLALLLLSELITDISSTESQMTIPEGERRFFSENNRQNELVFIDRSDPAFDRVVSIPARLLAREKTLTHPDLPFSVEPVRYFPNSQLARRGSTNQAPPSPADQGLGRHEGLPADILVTPLEEKFDEKTTNTATAYIRLTSREGVTLGTWLVSNLFDQRFPPQTVSVDGKSWELALRYQRFYHPFGLELLDFRFDRYPGTQIPKNFSSEVNIVHAGPDPVRKALIFMNNPLRYGGLTFYQASYDPETERTTILQVVRNPGWLLPYFSVLLMGAGMTLQFGLHLTRFAQRRAAASAA